MAYLAKGRIYPFCLQMAKVELEGKFLEVWSGGIPPVASVNGRAVRICTPPIYLLVVALPPGQPYLEGNRRETSRRKEKR
jgi:hypothetical protein